jgi:hypothetical protein
MAEIVEECSAKAEDCHRPLLTNHADGDAVRALVQTPEPGDPWGHVRIAVTCTIWRRQGLCLRVGGEHQDGLPVNWREQRRQEKMRRRDTWAGWRRMNPRVVGNEVGRKRRNRSGGYRGKLRAPNLRIQSGYQQHFSKNWLKFQENQNRLVYLKTRWFLTKPNGFHFDEFCRPRWFNFLNSVLTKNLEVDSSFF